MLQPKDTDWLSGYKNKTQTYAVWKKKHFRPTDTCRLRGKGWKKIFHANGNQKKFRVAFLISDEIDFKINNIARDKGHYITTEASIKEEGITIVNICVPNIRAPQYIRKILTDIKGKNWQQHNNIRGL